MGILIKGMEMPKNCLMCQFHGFGGYKNEFIVCSLTGRSEGQLSNVLGCPLVEVPAPHGRLIDADALLSIDRQIYNKDRVIGGRNFIYPYEVENMPTIIEAEEEER